MARELALGNKSNGPMFKREIASYTANTAPDYVAEGNPRHSTGGPESRTHSGLSGDHR